MMKESGFSELDYVVQRQYEAWAKAMRKAGDNDVSRHRFRCEILQAAVRAAVIEATAGRTV
jgi:hypothetical protein